MSLFPLSFFFSLDGAINTTRTQHTTASHPTLHPGNHPIQPAAGLGHYDPKRTLEVVPKQYPKLELELISLFLLFLFFSLRCVARPRGRAMKATGFLGNFWPRPVTHGNFPEPEDLPMDQFARGVPSAKDPYCICGGTCRMEGIFGRMAPVQARFCLRVSCLT